MTDWKVMGSVDPQGFTDDLTAESIISETSPGRYEAVVTLSVPTGRYFLRIER